MSSTLHYKVCVNEHGEVEKVTFPAREFANGTQNRYLLDGGLIFTEGSKICIYTTDEDLKEVTEKLVMHVVRLNLLKMMSLEKANSKLLANV